MTAGTDRPTTPVGGAGVAVRSMAATDADAVLAIYRAGLDAGSASLETTAPAWVDFDAVRLPTRRFVAAAGTMQSGIFGENTAGLALHERAGFRVVGGRERVGRHHGRWRDVVLIEGRSPTIT